MRKTGHPVEPEELMAYLDGELAPRAAETIAHLERCEECKKMVADLRTVSREMAAWEVEGAEFGMREAEVPVPMVLPNRRRWWLWAGAAAATATMVIAVGAALAPQSSVPAAYGTRLKALFTGVPGQLYNSEQGFIQGTNSPVGQQGGQQGFTDTDKFKARNPYAEISAPAPVPLITRTAEIYLIAYDFATARTRLDAILAARGGFTSQLAVSTPNEHARSIEGTLSVPATQLDSTLADLRKLGRVESESQNATDVTAQSVDLDARLSNARTTERSLLQLIANRGGALKDVLAVELEVGRVRGEIESMEAQRKSLSTQVARSTITIHISEEQRAQLASNGIGLRLRNAVVEGFRSMEDSLIDAGVLIVSRGPVILLWLAILFFPGRFAWRWWRRRSQ